MLFFCFFLVIGSLWVDHLDQIGPEPQALLKADDPAPKLLEISIKTSPFNAPWSAIHRGQLQKIGWDTLENRRKISRLCLMYKFFHKDSKLDVEDMICRKERPLQKDKTHSVTPPTVPQLIFSKDYPSMEHNIRWYCTSCHYCRF